ncbi:hypothetical protein RhiTH_004344 [Rhizoctonia solani]
MAIMIWQKCYEDMVRAMENAAYSDTYPSLGQTTRDKDALPTTKARSKPTRNTTNKQNNQDSYNASAETKKVHKKARNEYDEEQITAKKRKPGKTTRDVGFEEEDEDETDEGCK